MHTLDGNGGQKLIDGRQDMCNKVVSLIFLFSFRLSWLRQQQLKLAARRDERNPSKLWRQETGNRVIGELRSLQRGRLRHDGYASDSAVLDDDDDMWTGSSISGQVRKHQYIGVSL